MSDELTPEDRRLLSEVGFQVQAMNKRLDEVKTLLFGDHADGFMYKFARMEPDIERIPEIKKVLDDMVREVGNLSDKIGPLLTMAQKHDDYIKTQTVYKNVIVILISTATSAAVAVLTAWTLYNQLLEQLAKQAVKGGTP